jgi:hypothetical protein
MYTSDELSVLNFVMKVKAGNIETLDRILFSASEKIFVSAAQ